MDKKEHKKIKTINKYCLGQEFAIYDLYGNVCDILVIKKITSKFLYLISTETKIKKKMKREILTNYVNRGIYVSWD